MGVQFHLGEDLRVQADLLAIEQGDLPPDDPLVLEPLNTAPARRLRQPYALGNLRAGQ
ncbi:hypothetical protein D3C72_2595280 [compost metagenome]